MDYKTPIEIVNASKDFFDMLPDDKFINSLLPYNSLKKALAKLNDNGYKDIAGNTLMNYMVLDVQAETGFISDLKSLSIFKEWMYNKQIFTLDSNFIDVLLNTETISFQKDIFEFLPFKTFYVDLSNCENLKEDLLCDGIFFNTHKISLSSLEPGSRPYNTYIENKVLFKAANIEKQDDMWLIHSVRIKKDTVFHDMMIVPNISFEIAVNDINEDAKITEFLYDKSNRVIPTEKIKVNLKERIYTLFRYQFLTYLASYKPDITENEDTKRNYKKPNEYFKPKNKFSEIKAYDVGYKIGTAFRDWKKALSVPKTTSLPTGRKNRPHAVRAHWRKQWYGPRNAQEQRLIWINEFYTGTKSVDSIAVIHKVTTS